MQRNMIVLAAVVVLIIAVLGTLVLLQSLTLSPTGI